MKRTKHPIEVDDPDEVVEEVEGIVIDQGRPTKYRDTFVSMTKRLCLLCHSLNEVATIQMLASFFEVGDATITRWMKEHDEFRVVVKEGRKLVAGAVADSLFRKAIGYDYTEVRITTNSAGKEMSRIETTKHVPGDTGAICFALKNWAPEHYRDRREIAGVGGTALIPARSRLDVHLLADDALDVLMSAILTDDKSDKKTETDDDVSTTQPALH